MPAIELPESARTSISNAMLVLASKGKELERQRQQTAKAAANRLIRERREQAQNRLRSLRRERHETLRIAIAAQGLHVLYALAQSDEIQGLLAQRHLARHGILADEHENIEEFTFYYGTSRYDLHAPDFASIILDQEGVELGYGVQKIDDRPRIRFDFDKRYYFDDEVASLVGTTGKPLRYLAEREFGNCTGEGSGALFGVLYDCASPRRFEKYLEVAIKRFAGAKIDTW